MSKVTIRDASPNDAEALAKIYAYYVENTAISFEWEAPTVEEFRERIEATMKRFPYIVAEIDGKAVGYAYAGSLIDRKAYDWTAELSIYVDKDVRKGGVGRSLYTALEDELKRRGFVNLYACIALPDEDDEYLTSNSMDFHAHMGYEKVGIMNKCGYKFGRWYNLIWMEKFIGEHGQK